MREIEMSIMDHGPEFQSVLESLLDDFHSGTGYRVRLRLIPWRGAWSEMVQVALYGDGPTLSEVGNTWVGDFVGMNSLRPFSSTDLWKIGGSTQFLRSSWESGTVSGTAEVSSQLWAIPWSADTRILYYRRDLLEQAGIDPEMAFHSAEALECTASQLQARGIQAPWTVPTTRSRMTLHNLSSWVWGAGGSFLTPDFRRTAFGDPQAVAGMCAYFNMLRFIPLEARGVNETASDNLYSQGKAAMTVSGPWLPKVKDMDSKVTANTGRTLAPGVPYVGGSHLVIWKRAQNHEPALELVRLLASADVQSKLAREIGTLPTHLDVLSSEMMQSDPFYKKLSAGLRDGRAFPSFTLWGLVENKLTEATSAIWADLLADPSSNVKEVVERHITPLARRLNITLTS